MKKVTAAVLSYNYEEYIEGRIDSVLGQSYPVSELLILDDCSTDGSVEIIERKAGEVRKRFPEMKVRVVVNEKNSGNVFRQWEKAFRLATGEYIWICEADDTCSSKFLETVMKGFDDTEVVLSYTESYAVNNYDDLVTDNLKFWNDVVGKDFWEEDYVRDGKKELSEILAIKNTIPNVSGVVIKNDPALDMKKYLKEAQKFRLAGDWYVYSEILMHGKIAYFKDTLNCHRVHSGSVLGSIKKSDHLREEKMNQEHVQGLVKITKHAREMIEKYDQELADAARFNEGEVKVSVLVPIYNVEKYLRQCLDSLTGQTLREIEIICIDDGSTDGSGEILREYAKKDERIVVIEKKNSGYGDSMNQGLERAQGEYIGILEPDDFIELDAYEKMYRRAKEFGAEVVRANYYRFRDDEDKKYEAFSGSRTGRLLDPAIEPGVFTEPPAIWSAIYRNEFLKHHGIDFLTTPGASYQDTSFNFKVWASAHSVVLMSEAFVHYRLDNEGSSVNQLDKADFVRTEYAEIERFLGEKRLMMNLGGLMEWVKFRTYYWNLQRMTPELAVEFLKEMRKEFRRAEKEGLLQKVYFRFKEKAAYWMIMNLKAKRVVKMIGARKKMRGGK